MEIDEKKLIKEAPKLGIKMVILFGSQSSGRTRKNSDYDIAVLTTGRKGIGESMDYYSKVLYFLRNALKLPDYKIDLTNLNNAGPFLSYEIFRNCRLIYGNEIDFASMQAYAMREYIATQDLRELEEKLIYKRQELLAKKIYA